MSSDPVTRSNTPSAGPSRISAPPIPPSKNLPTNFGASIGIWWNNSGYKEARVAEERLLRRMEIFERIQAEQVVVQAGDDGEGEVSMVGERDGMKASLRNVSIPTPDPAEAPAHPADPAPTTSRSSATSSTSSLSQSGGRGEKKNAGRRKSGTKMGDYINTLEISSRENMGSKEAVVVNHGYAAAMGYVRLQSRLIKRCQANAGNA
jgi:cardiolipin-specific phospholipase